MIRGLYTSGVGMIAQMNRMDVLTNNIANADTTGYKKDIAVVHSFPEELAKRLDDPSYKNMMRHAADIGNVSLGAHVNLIHTDFSKGNYKKTDGIFDMTISGEGFFAVNVTDKDGNVSEKYTRDGSFLLSNDRYLLTSDGLRVQGESGDIQIPGNGEITIGSKGEIYMDGAMFEQLKIVNFQNPDTLRKYGQNLYSTTDDTVMSDFSGGVIQGFLENSNVNIVREMVDMITVSRVYEANSKAIQTHDATLTKAVSEIGRK